MPAVSNKLNILPKVTRRQEQFAQIVAKTNDPIQAGKLAYPNQVNSYTQAVDNLNKPNVVERINQLRTQMLDCLQSNDSTTIPGIARKLVQHIDATKDIVLSDGTIVKVRDNETQSKAVDKLITLYQLAKPQESSAIALNFNVDTESLHLALAKMDKLAERLGFDQGQTGEVIDVKPCND